MTPEQFVELMALLGEIDTKLATFQTILSNVYVAALATAYGAGVSAGLLAAQHVTRSLTLKRWWT